MRSWLRVGAVGVIGAAAVAACKFAPAEQRDGGNPVDAPGSAADAGPCIGESVECADPETLRTCTVAGGIASDMPCSWGCNAAGVAHCAVLVPSGGAATSGDLDPTGLASTTLPDNAQIDGSAGSIDHGIRDMGGNNTIDKGVGWSLRGNVAVFRFGDLTIAGRLKFAQPNDNSQPYAAIVLVSSGSITVNGAIDAEGNCTNQAGGPGAFVGGINGLDATGSGGGSGGGAQDSTRGGGGGGYGAAGGSGGMGGTNPAVAGGSAFGDDIVTTLIGGGGGGAGGHGGVPHGGGGGGAIQLVANATITINANGSINAGGCSGKSGTANQDSGGGGGAGGTILLEAHDIIITGQLAVNGGGGGAGSTNTGNDEGGSATLGRTQAPGSTHGAAAGGSGGAGAVLVGDPGLGAGTYGGGGGGSVGRIRFNTRTGAASVDNSMLSPALTDMPTTCTLGSATTQ